MLAVRDDDALVVVVVAGGGSGGKSPLSPPLPSCEEGGEDRCEDPRDEVEEDLS